MLAAGRGAIVNLGSMSGTICNRPQPQTRLQRLQGGGASHDPLDRRRMGAAGRARQRRGADLHRDRRWSPRTRKTRARIEAWLRDTPMGRMGQAHEVASAVLFLASDAASLMTGAVVPVDAGFTCW